MLLARFDSHTQALNVTIVTGILIGGFFAPSRAGSTVNPVDFFDPSDTVQTCFLMPAGPFCCWDWIWHQAYPGWRSGSIR
jgi:hypothetical protein